MSSATTQEQLTRVLEVAACPTCRDSELEVQPDAILCPRCGERFRLHDGVPDFTQAGEDSYSGFDFQWQRRREGAFEEERLYGKTEAEEEHQFFAFTGVPPEGVEKLRILDAGCGSGRLVRLLSRKGLNVVGLDFTSTVRAIRRAARNEGLENLTLIQGDLLRPPLKVESFDVIWSGGVIHHTPDARAALRSLVALLRPGGRVYVWVYSVDQGVFGRIRQLLPFAHRLPGPILLVLCRLLAVPVWLLGVVTGRHHPMTEVVFKLFDHLSPRYRTVHSEAEMREWFAAEGLGQVEVPVAQSGGGVGIRGVR